MTALRTAGHDGGTQVAGVAGWPVAHSLSPLLHRTWLEALGLDHVYAPFAVRPETAGEAFRHLRALGIVGVNVTIPLKAIALQAADQRSALAEAVGAANLLTVAADGALHAENTDVAGVAHALAEAGPRGAADMALVLGAGGAARAVLYALMQDGWRRVIVANRSEDRARALCEDAARWPFDARLEAIAWDARADALAEAGLIINATSLGMAGQPPLALDLTSARDDAVVFDSVYTPLETPLLAAARTHGLRTVDGLAMLIGQAIPSFEAFFGLAPPRDVDGRGALVARLTERAREADA